VFHVKVLDVFHNVYIDAVKSESWICHFVYDLLFAEVLKYEAVHRYDESCSVGTVMTVNQQWMLSVLDDFQGMYHVVVIDMVCHHTYPVEFESGVSGEFFVRVPVSQVEYFFYSVLFEMSKLLFVGLFGTIHSFVHFIKIVHAETVDFDGGLSCERRQTECRENKQNCESFHCCNFLIAAAKLVMNFGN
jgi:hypothetical protein